MPKFNILAPVALGLAMITQSASAIPPEDSPYNTDSQQFYVEDVTQEPIEFISHILCYVTATKHPEFVNQGAYNAWVDRNICEKPDLEGEPEPTADDLGNASSDLDLDSPKYWTMRVRASRENSSEPHIVRAHGLYQEPDEPNEEIYIYAEVYEAPDDNNPVDGGKFELQLDANGTRVILKVEKDKVYFKGEGSDESVRQNEHVFLQRQTAEAGIGFQENAGKQTRISYNSDYFCRQSGNQPYCFSRALDEATLMPWRYTRYGSDGEPIKRSEGTPLNSMPIVLTLGSGEDMYLEFEREPYLSNEALAKLAAAPVETFESARNPDTGEIYELVWSRSKLAGFKYIESSLADISGVRFRAALKNNETLLLKGYEFKNEDFADYEFYWSEAEGGFILTREIPENETQSKSINLTLTPTELETYFKTKWSPDIDGLTFNIPDGKVTYTKRVEFRPGDADLPADGARFKCWGRCYTPEWYLNPSSGDLEYINGGNDEREIFYQFHTGESDKDYGLYWDNDGELEPVGWTKKLDDWLAS